MMQFIKEVMPQHLTIYMLEVNEGSKLYAKPALLSILPAQEQVVEKYIRLCFELKDLGYQHYEVSNFSRGANYRSRHSSTYWQGDKQYLAYGMGATSLTSQKRITRPRTISKYLKYVELLDKGDIPYDLLEIAEETSVKDRLSTVMLSGIRT